MIFVTNITGKAGSLRMVLKASRPVYDGGRKIGTVPGISIQFEKGSFETKDKDIIERLMKHPSLGRTFFAAGEKKEEKSEDQNKTAKNGSNDELTKKTAKELLAICKERGIEVSEDAKKPQLLELLK